MCYPTPALAAVQQAIPNSCLAKQLPPSQRLQLGVQAVAKAQTITELATQAAVSRKFVQRQAAIARQALDDAFAPAAIDDAVLFHLPVTKQWLQQFTLALVLIGHCPLRGVVEILRDLLDHEISLGNVFNIVQAAVEPARRHNQAQDLSRVRVGAHDEIFQARAPVLVGVDPLSTYCYLLSREAQRDADTWGVRLLELQARGFHPDFVVADAGQALRAAQAEVMPDVPCRSDVFHALHEIHEVVGILENRAYAAMAEYATSEIQTARSKHRQGRADASAVAHGRHAAPRQTQAIQLADDIAMLARWLRGDVLALAGPTHVERIELYDFIVAELKARASQAPKLLGRLLTYLRRQRDNLLAFAAQLDHDLAELANRFAVAAEQVRDLFAVQALPHDSPRRWHRDAPLRRLLGDRYFPLSEALDDLRRRSVRASSSAENLNSRLRNYFFLRRHLGNDYLTLLQFFLNHRRFPRSTRAERRGKSPAEILTVKSHAHWLELPGYTRFPRH